MLQRGCLVFITEPCTYKIRWFTKTMLQYIGREQLQLSCFQLNKFRILQAYSIKITTMLLFSIQRLLYYQCSPNFIKTCLLLGCLISYQPAQNARTPSYMCISTVVVFVKVVQIFSVPHSHLLTIAQIFQSWVQVPRKSNVAEKFVRTSSEYLSHLGRGIK